MSIKRTKTISKGFIGAIIASSVLLGASSPIKNTKQETLPAQTELMSKESVEALKANSLQQTPTVPTVHNPKLDAILMKFAENQDDSIYVKKFLNDTYSNYGTYMGSAIIQSEIDINMFLSFIDGNKEILKGFPNGEKLYYEAMIGDTEKIKTKSEELKKWIQENHAAVYSPLFYQFDHKPTSQETIDALDEYVKINNHTFENRYWQIYTNPSEEFEKKQQNSNNSIVQKRSDLIAYKMYLADMSLFRNLLKSAGFKRGNMDNLNMYHAYEWGFIPAIVPSAD